MARNIAIAGILLLGCALATAQPRGQWKYFEKSAAPEYVALTASDSLGRWVPVGELLSGANAVYGTGSAGALAEWATDSTLTFDATGGIQLPVGSNIQRPTTVLGQIRVNTLQDSLIEYWNGIEWDQLFTPWQPTAAGIEFPNIPGSNIVRVEGTLNASFITTGNTINAPAYLNTSGGPVYLGTSTSYQIRGFSFAATSNLQTMNVYGNSLNRFILQVGGAEKIRIQDYVNFNTTNAIMLPDGTTAQRPTGAAALLRYNTDTTFFEAHDGTQWRALADRTWVNTSRGTGTANYVPRWSDVNTLENSTFLTNAGNTRAGTNGYVDALAAFSGYAPNGYSGGASSVGVLSYADLTTNHNMSFLVPHYNYMEITNGDVNFGDGFAAVTFDDADIAGGAIINQFFGKYADYDFSGNTINSSLYGDYIRITLNGSTVQNVIGYSVKLPMATSSVTNRYAILLDTIDGAASGDDYAIYSIPTQPSYFAGNIGIKQTDAAYTLDMGGATDGARLPVGTTAQRPTGAAGVIRYNSDSTAVEFHNGTAWATVGGGGADGNGIYDGSGTFTQDAIINLDNAYTLEAYAIGSTSGADGAVKKVQFQVDENSVFLTTYKNGALIDLTNQDFYSMGVDTSSAFITIPGDTTSGNSLDRIIVSQTGLGTGTTNGKLTYGPHPGDLAMKNATLEQYSGFNTYTSDPDTLTPSPGALIGFDNATFGWTQILAPDNLETGDEVIILIVNADTNTLTLDATGAAGFIRPRTNGDFAADATEAFTDAYSTLRLVWDGTNFWILEN